VSDREEQLQILEASAASGWFSAIDALQHHCSARLARTGERVLVTRISRIGQNWRGRLPTTCLQLAGSPDEFYVGPVVHFATTSHVWPRDLPSHQYGYNATAQAAANSSRRWQQQHGRGVLANQQAAAFRRRKAAAWKAVKGNFSADTDWNDIDGWPAGRWRDYDDRQIWEAVFWCVLHREDLFLHFAGVSPPEDGRLTFTDDANQWLATRPLFHGLLRESGRRNLTFSGNTLTFIEACIAARRGNHAIGEVPDPWRDPELQQEQVGLNQELRTLGQPQGRQGRWLDLSGDAS
jgi:hypothetical protein